VIERVDLGVIDYHQATKDMATWVAQRQAGKVGDRLFLLEHPPVITYGRRTDPTDLPAELNLPTIEVDRGGFATYHGPGQLVGYLVISVDSVGDVVRWLELRLIDALGTLGVDAIRRDTPKGASSLVGIWTPDHRKIASIGMRIRRGVTSHGFALNVDPDMAVFDRFTACGLHDVRMTSIRQYADEHGMAMPTNVRDAVAATFA
jgi:lipoyl(octanoyl) transferase